MRTIYFILAVLAATTCGANEFDQVQPLIIKHCLKCHGGDEVNGEVNFKNAASAKQFLAQPVMIKEMIEALDGNNMPPEGEPLLPDETRAKLIASLKSMLREATAGKTNGQVQIRRLNRFQYNNAIKDLFQLKLDVFKLPEKLMTRHSNYLQTAQAKMPDRVSVASHSLKPREGLREVRAFPQDLRASHGYDNQANQLSLSPLLLDAFLRLSVSIVESPDFNDKTVGIWNDFFKEPAKTADIAAEVKRRLEPFMKLAFRGPVDEETVDRYAAYAVGKMKLEMSFTDSMKKVVSAILSSPRFIYRVGAEDGSDRQFQLASNLSFFLWASGPDAELLSLAARGELSKRDVLNKTIDRMLADPKIERFLDTFPGQWMQLENVLAATPDPQKYRLFSLDQNHPASLQMVLEPLLLFDAVFIEDRPVIDLIAPKFGYQSEFLKTWYVSDLRPPKVDRKKIEAENQIKNDRRALLNATITQSQAALNGIVKPLKERLLAAKQKETGNKAPVNLKPYAAWEFDDNLKSSVNSLDLVPHGKVEFKDGMVVLNKSYLLSKPLPIDLRAKSLEVWCLVHNVNERGGGLMGIQGPGDFFDTIVLGERKPQHWISGSNGFSRTLDFPESTPETKPNEMIHLAMVYQQDGTTTLYRNGQPYGKPFRKGAATFPKNRTSVIFGLRHLPAGGNKFLTVSIDKARVYNRALTAEEVAASASGSNLYVTNDELLAAMTPEQKTKRDELVASLAKSKDDLKKVPANQDPNKAQDDMNRRFDDEIRNKMRSQTFDRVATDDPRYGGVITNAAMLSMTSGPKRTHPIARGAWIIEVIFNDPPPPPPNDVPALNEEATNKNLTIREKFKVHRENPNCAGCHSKLDPLGFALENFDITGRWRDKYENGRDVDATGTLIRKYPFEDPVLFKAALVNEQRRFAKAFTAHLLRFATARELAPADTLTIDTIIDRTAADNFKLKSLMREVVLSDSFLGK